MPDKVLQVHNGGHRFIDDLVQDTIAAILMPGFHDSKWTDQEIGFALGRGMLVVPLRHGLDPYGFIGKLQGVPCHGKTVAQVANSVFQALASNSLTKNKIATALVDQVVASPTPSTGTKFFNSLRQIETLAQSHLERLRDNIATNLRLASDAYFVKELNALLIEREIQPFEQPERALVPNDDLPF